MITEQVNQGAFDALKVVLPTMAILMAIGVMIGAWMQSGTIPTIIVYGLNGHQSHVSADLHLIVHSCAEHGDGNPPTAPRGAREWP